MNVRVGVIVRLFSLTGKQENDVPLERGRLHWNMDAGLPGEGNGPEIYGIQERSRMRVLCFFSRIVSGGLRCCRSCVKRIQKRGHGQAPSVEAYPCSDVA